MTSSGHSFPNASVARAPTPFAAPVDSACALSSGLMNDLSAQIQSSDSQTIVRAMRRVNLVLGALTVAVGVLAWGCGQVDTFQKAIAGIYIILFGALLLAFELRSEKTDVVLRTNFGFMYGNKTRTLFLVFIAIWPLSMGNFWLTILDAMLLFLNAFFNFFVISKHPAFSAVPPAHDFDRPREFAATGYTPSGAPAIV
ncbi:unnamed protein product [Hyaloperonospora brassicae]|uniref:Uncharacterized protein n=1 Tax=Hyaloperonospora brassicae TaxID=162125 RepID=A0AAV0UBT3_HYABA|nr:unnamed protein product [Hyaloperonospora brassicae]